MDLIIHHFVLWLSWVRWLFELETPDATGMFCAQHHPCRASPEHIMGVHVCWAVWYLVMSIPCRLVSISISICEFSITQLLNGKLKIPITHDNLECLVYWRVICSEDLRSYCYPQTGFTSWWVSSQKAQPGQRSGEGRLCYLQPVRRTARVFPKAVSPCTAKLGRF